MQNRSDRTRRGRWARRALLLTAAAAVALAGRPAEARAQDDMATLAAYRLTAGKLERFAQATRNVFAAAADPAVRAQMKQLEDDGDDEPSIGDLAARLDRVTPVRAAIAKSGMSTRDYVTFQFSLLQASVAVAVMDMQPGTKLPEGTPQANVDFVRQHKARLDALTAEVKKMEALLKAGDDDDDAPDDDDPPPARR